VNDVTSVDFKILERICFCQNYVFGQHPTWWLRTMAAGSIWNTLEKNSMGEWKVFI